MRALFAATLLYIIFLYPQVHHAQKANAYMYFSRGLLYLNANMIEEAIEEFQKVIHIDSKSVPAYEYLAKLYFECGEYKHAKKCAKILTKLDRNSTVALCVLAKIYLLEGKFDTAATFAKAAFAINPKDKECYYLLLELASNLEGEEAITIYKELIDKEPTQLPAYMELAKYYHNCQDFNEAIKILNIAKDIASNKIQVAQIHECLAMLYIHTEQLQLAKMHLDYVINENPSSFAYYLLGCVYVMEDKLDLAEQAFVQALELDDDNINAYIQLGYLYLEKKELQKARNIALSALKQKKTAKLLYLLGEISLCEKEYQQAKAFFEAALALDPDDADILYRLGVVNERQGNISAAEKYFYSYIERRPDDASAYNYLGYTYVEKGIKLAEAKILIEKALEQEPRNGAYIDSLGWLYYQLGLFDVAIKILFRAYKLLPNDEVICEHLGDAFRSKGNLEKAKIFYKKAIELGGENLQIVIEKLQASENYSSLEKP